MSEIPTDTTPDPSTEHVDAAPTPESEAPATDAPPAPEVPFEQFLKGAATAAAGYLLNAAIDLIQGNPEALVEVVHNIAGGLRAIAEEPEFARTRKENQEVVATERKNHREDHWLDLERAFKNVIEAKKADVSDEVVLRVLDQFDPVCEGPGSPLSSVLDNLVPIFTQAFQAGVGLGGPSGRVGHVGCNGCLPMEQRLDQAAHEHAHGEGQTLSDILAREGVTFSDLIARARATPGVTITEFPPSSASVFPSAVPAPSPGVVGAAPGVDVPQHMTSADLSRHYGVPLSPVNPNVPAAGRWIFIPMP